MKKYFRRKLGLMLVMLAGAMSCGSPKNISRVSLLSERQINASAHYELKALARTGTGATIQEAVAAVVKQAPGGLFIQNAEISYLKKEDKNYRRHLGTGRQQRAYTADPSICSRPGCASYCCGRQGSFRYRAGYSANRKSGRLQRKSGNCRSDGAT